MRCGSNIIIQCLGAALFTFACFGSLMSGGLRCGTQMRGLAFSVVALKLANALRQPLHKTTGLNCRCCSPYQHLHDGVPAFFKVPL